MSYVRPAFCALSLLAACGTTNPITDGSGGGTAPTGGAGAGTNLTFNEGTGLYTLQRVAYNSATNTLVVEGVPFDGNDEYTASAIALGQNGARPMPSVYQADPTTVDDSYDGGADGPIFQHDYYAIRNETTSGNARAAVVRSGSYEDHGFGGYVVGRDANASLPTTGQANYSGNYAGLRTFNGAGGIEFTDGDMSMEIDFNRTEDNGALRGSVTNRRLFNDAGAQIGTLPAIGFDIQAGAIEDNGQFGATLSTDYYKPDATEGQDVTTATGTFRGVLSGTNASEAAGVIDITFDDYFVRNGNATVNGTPVAAFGDDSTTITETRETGIFVLQR